MSAWWHGGGGVEMAAFIVSMISQKGGVGKSTLARILASVFASLDWNVKLADLDISQGTSFRWRGRRLENNIEPDVPVEQFGTVAKVLALADKYDLLVLDGAPHATKATQDIAKASHLNIIPTGLSRDDLDPAVILAHDLVKSGVPRNNIVFALCKVGESPTEIDEARAFLRDAGYDILPGSIPEKTGYRRAADQGRALTETRFASLNHRAEELAQGIVDRISQFSEDTAKTQRKRSAA
jgi:chromosome partitioning protein